VNCFALVRRTDSKSAGAISQSCSINSAGKLMSLSKALELLAQMIVIAHEAKLSQVFV